VLGPGGGADARLVSLLLLPLLLDGPCTCMCGASSTMLTINTTASTNRPCAGDGRDGYGVSKVSHHAIRGTQQCNCCTCAAIQLPFMPHMSGRHPCACYQCPSQCGLLHIFGCTTDHQVCDMLALQALVERVYICMPKVKAAMTVEAVVNQRPAPHSPSTLSRSP
jgi:hypothetical protein